MWSREGGAAWKIGGSAEKSGNIIEEILKSKTNMEVLLPQHEIQRKGGGEHRKSENVAKNLSRSILKILYEIKCGLSKKRIKFYFDDPTEVARYVISLNNVFILKKGRREREKNKRPLNFIL